MKSLIVIDFQKDFRNGTLPVPGAVEAEDAIYRYIVNNHNEIAEVIFTVDWHSPNHCSFKKNGGIWPPHCVQFSEGAGISDKLMQTCIDYNLPVKIFKKGVVDDKEEYGAFDFIQPYEFTNCDGNEDTCFTVNNCAHNSKVLVDTTDLVVCGLAGDYCVKESLKNLMKFSGPFDIKLSVLKDGVGSIDGGKAFMEFVNEHGIEVI